MKINFAQVPNEDLGYHNTDELYGPDEFDNYYYNCVEFGTNPGGTDEVSIQDGCNRTMPIAVEHIPDLITALEECLKLSNELCTLEKIQQHVLSEIEAYSVGNSVQY